VTNDANIRAAEMKLKRLLGAQVRIRFGQSGQSGGKMEISFASVTDLDRIYSIIMSKTDTGSPLPTVL
jgi:predicted NUDIX family NTP pyrophosphohydrolase